MKCSKFTGLELLVLVTAFISISNVVVTVNADKKIERPGIERVLDMNGNIIFKEKL